MLCQACLGGYLLQSIRLVGCRRLKLEIVFSLSCLLNYSIPFSHQAFASSSLRWELLESVQALVCLRTPESQIGDAMAQDMDSPFLHILSDSSLLPRSRCPSPATRSDYVCMCRHVRDSLWQWGMRSAAPQDVESPNHVSDPREVAIVRLSVPAHCRFVQRCYHHRRRQHYSRSLASSACF